MPAFLLLFLWVWNPFWAQVGLAQNNDVCVGPDLDWYTQSVGETPCRTYERLRQICNSQFQTPVMSINTPPDHCTDQLGDCCCNSIAFALSMLCLNCQKDNNSANGIDAGVGAYQDYVDAQPNHCTPTNQSLPNDIQSAACNQGIKIMDGLYGLFWVPGAWYYTYTRETLVKDIDAKNNQVFSHCSASTTSSQSGSTTTASSSSSSSSPSSPSSSSSSSPSSPSSPSPSSSGSSSSSPGQSKTSSGGQAQTTSLSSNTSSSSSSAISAPDVVAGQSSSSTGGSATILPNTDVTSTSNHLGGGAIAGIVVGVLIALLLAALAAFLLYRRRNNHESPAPVAPFQAYSGRPVSSSAGAWSGSTSDQTGYSYDPVQPSVTDLGGPLRPNRPGKAHRYQESMSERHRDAGPVRVPSGRLPPAYDRSWEDDSSPSS